MDVSQTLVSFIHTAFLVMVYHTWTKKKKKTLVLGLLSLMHLFKLKYNYSNYKFQDLIHDRPCSIYFP